jgi:hypothetical protein
MRVLPLGIAPLMTSLSCLAGVIGNKMGMPAYLKRDDRPKGTTEPKGSGRWFQRQAIREHQMG